MTINLSKISTKAPDTITKEEAKDKLKELKKTILELQTMLLANNGPSVLVILQGLDASGKDGIVRDVFTGLNPTNCSIYSFKKPTELEMRHDFLWRVHQQVPAAGEIKIFNRSHYEDVLIQRVHNWIDEATCEQRYQAINNFETLLIHNDTKIVKCYLHVSPEKQLERLTERREKPDEHYKHNDNDWKERELWDQYMEAYHLAFERCQVVPWHIIPADQGWYKSLVVAELLADTLQNLKLSWPEIKN